MNRKLWAALFVCSLVIWTIGNGLLPLLPVYALKLGADQAITGYFMSFAFLSLAVGAPVAGWLSDRFQRRKSLLIIVGFLGVPTVFLMSKATTIMQFALMTGVSWFLYGMALSLVSTIAGLFAEEASRGKIFGLLGTTAGLGALIGGLATGPLVDRWGYPFMFVVLSVISVILPVAGFFLKDKVLSRSQQPKVRQHEGSSRLGMGLILLLTAHAIAVVVNGMGNLGRSLVMNELRFTPTAITSTMAVSGLVLVALPVVIGWLSDRVGRKLLMVVCYLAFAICMPILNLSRSLWHFWVFTVFMSLGFVSNTVGSALVTDLVQQDRLGWSMSLFQDMFWVGNVIGFAITGLLIENIGMPNTFLLGIIPPSVAIILLVFAKTKKAKA